MCAFRQENGGETKNPRLKPREKKNEKKNSRVTNDLHMSRRAGRHESGRARCSASCSEFEFAISRVNHHWLMVDDWGRDGVGVDQ
jgi:hypothetical protein